MNCTACEDSREVGILPHALPLFSELEGRPFYATPLKARRMLRAHTRGHTSMLSLLLVEVADDVVGTPCPYCPKLSTDRVVQTGPGVRDGKTLHEAAAG